MFYREDKCFTRKISCLLPGHRGPLKKGSALKGKNVIPVEGLRNSFLLEWNFILRPIGSGDKAISMASVRPSVRTSAHPSVR